MALTARMAANDNKIAKAIMPEALMPSGIPGLTTNDKYLKENLTALVAKVGEMQAQLIRLDALGERVQGLGRCEA